MCAHGEGAYFFDLDGNKYLDFNFNYTTLIHGHSHPAVTAAVIEQVKAGICFGTTTPNEADLAQILCDRVPGVERAKFMCSGTEAVMAAIKAARAFTGRTAIAKLEGGYHGSYDYAEVSTTPRPDAWGSNIPSPVPESEGCPADVLQSVVVLPMNDVERSIALLDDRKDEIGAILIDPMSNRAGMVPLSEAYVKALHKFAKEAGALFITDQVVNFRQGYEGAMPRYGVVPDLVVFGKIVGGGFPAGALGGRKDVMEMFDWARGPMKANAAGTASSNPVAMMAGKTVLAHLTPEVFKEMDRLGERVRSGLRDALRASGCPGCVTGRNSLFRLHLVDRPVENYRDSFLTKEEGAKWNAFYQGLLARGIYLPAGGLSNVSSITRDEDVETLLNAAEDVLRELP